MISLESLLTKLKFESLNEVVAGKNTKGGDTTGGVIGDGKKPKKTKGLGEGTPPPTTTPTGLL